MKRKLILTTCALGLLLSGCGVKNSAKKSVAANTSVTTIKQESHTMALSNASTTFTHVATFQSPMFNGHRLQATSILKSNNLLYITYNTQYDAVRGGLDIISLSSTNVPTVLSSKVSENSEFAEAKLKGNYLYMVGQKKVDDKTFALISVVNIANPSSPVFVSEMTFSGYYATAIDLQDSFAYITIPSIGVKKIDISNPASLIDLGNTSVAAGNSLFVRRLGDKSLVLGGSSAQKLSILSSTNQVISIANTAQQAPSRFKIKDSYLYTNGGSSGLNILKNISTTTPTLAYSGSLTGTGNGLTVGSCNKLYLAQGEKGLQVYNVSNKTAPVNEGTFDFTTDSGSANNVFHIKSGSNQFVFVADGLSGVQMVKVQSTECDSSCDEDTDDNETTTAGLFCKVYDLSATKPSALPVYSTMTPIGNFIADKLDVINQTSANSFPKFTTTALKAYTDWYGISCTGYWKAPYTGSGVIALTSDDGSKLYINDVLTINNDGLHGTSEVTAPVVLVKDLVYKLKIDYFQGPHSGIQLELKQKPLLGTEVYMNGFYH